MKCYKSVSVIIPCYNSGKTIKNCISSVLNQTYPIHEIIVIDDGSTDNSFEIVSKIQMENNFEKFISFKQKNAGPSKARNVGIMNSTGDFIAFLDSDDEWINDKIEHQITAFEKNTTVGIIGTNYVVKGNTLNNTLQEHQIIPFKKLLFKNYFVTSSVMVKRTVMIQHLFDTKKKFVEDYDAWLRIVYENEGVFLPQVLVVYNKPLVSSTGLSSNLLKMEIGELKVYISLFKERKIGYLFFIIIPYSILKYIKRVFSISTRLNYILLL
jgi:glycosyltransferase involved in cell wall biosynthesis